MVEDDLNRKFELAIKQAREIREKAIPKITVDGNITSQATETLLETLEELHVAQEELTEANDELIAMRNALEAEKIRYQNLFEFAPYGYLVTDTLGCVEEANNTICSMLNLKSAALIGKPLAVYIVQDDITQFRKQLRSLPSDGLLAHFKVRMKPRAREIFPAMMVVQSQLDEGREIIGIRWLISNHSQNEIKSESPELPKGMHTHANEDLLSHMVSREIRIVGLGEAIEKLRRQIEDAGMKPVADDPLYESDD